MQTGRVDAAPDGVTPVTIDVPSGRVVAHVRQDAGTVTGVVFENVASYPVARSVGVDTSVGRVFVDLAFGGALYACVEASELGLEVTPEHCAELTKIGREVKWALNDSELACHRDDGRVDRSPCGSGTAARLALLADSGRLGPNQVLTHDSIIGTRFIGRAREVSGGDGRHAVIPEVEGMAYKTGEHTFALEAGDPLDTGFLLR